MASLDAKPYMVKAGDTMSSIAKQFGFVKWEDIYNNPANQSLRALRPNPNMLKPGDRIMIPPTAAQVQQVLQKRLTDLTQLRQQTDVMYQHILAELDSNLKHYQNVAEGADLAATVAGLFTGLTKIAIRGWSAMKLSGPALEAANKELAKEGLKFAYEPLEDPALKLAAKEMGAHEDGLLWALGKCSIEAFLNIQSPSWWAGVIGNLKDGKSWSQAVTSNPEEQIGDVKQRIQFQRQQMLNAIDTKINETRSLLNGVQTSGLVSLYDKGMKAYA